MNERNSVEPTPTADNPAGPYLVYSAGGLFTQHELAMNVLVKEAVWRLSGGRFQLLLPQSRELEALDRPDVKAYIRNTDLLEVVGADIILAYFDGLELDSGTVAEFCTAKFLGKPAVILRSDFRRQNGPGLSEPFNLMVKNWPRTIEIELDSYVLWAGLLAEERQAKGGRDPLQAQMDAELNLVRKSTDEIARRVVAGLEAVIQLESPYPPEYRELAYQIFRFSPGSGFDQLLPQEELDQILSRLKKSGTL